MKKSALRCFLVLLFLSLLALPTAAEDAELAVETGEIADEMADFYAAIPPEVADLLPADFFSEDMLAMGESVREASALSSVLSVIGRLTGLAIGEHLSLLAKLCGILLLAAVLRALVAGDETAPALERAVSLCSGLSLAVLIVAQQAARFREISAYFEVMQGIGEALIPLMGALYAMGGNVGAAVANHAVLSAFLAILETACAGTVIPVASLCICLALTEAVSGNLSLRSLGALIKRTYTWTLSLLMLLLCGVLGIQSTLAKGTDTIALRTVRFAASSFLPVVGGSLSEALRTVSGSVQYLRTVVGTGAILVLLFAFLPIFLSVTLGRITFLLSGTVARLLGCEREERLLGEFASVYGYFLAVIAALFVMTVFALTLFAHCATAVG